MKFTKSPFRVDTFFRSGFMDRKANRKSQKVVSLVKKKKKMAENLSSVSSPFKAIPKMLFELNLVAVFFDSLD